jgi:hypothetical protein
MHMIKSAWFRLLDMLEDIAGTPAADAWLKGLH